MAGCRYRDEQGAFGASRGANLTHRAKNRVKRSLLGETEGGPLAAVVAGANIHDTMLLATTLDAVVVERTLAWL